MGGGGGLSRSVTVHRLQSASGNPDLVTGCVWQGRHLINKVTSMMHLDKRGAIPVSPALVVGALLLARRVSVSKM